MEARHSGLEIAVVGMAGRFPGAASVQELWHNLAAGIESVRFFADDELLAAGVAPEMLVRPDYVRARAPLADADHFDAALFGFSPFEAAVLDPQHRLFLESAWAALEDAGHSPEGFPGPVGVYAGVSESTYFLRQIWNNRQIARSLGAFQAAVAHERDFFATRVSYKLGLEGPSLTVQTACSTSLVAVHLACQALLAGECDLALAGGASVTVPQVAGYLYQEGGIASPDGHSRAFDARAAGTVSGDGVGVVVLRRLQDALDDGDSIRSILLGTAVNNDGPRRAGYTAPSVEGQARVVRAALAASGVAAESIGYVEAHGAATPLGDPTEITALNRAFAAAATMPLPQESCAVGSVKTNIGHLDAAAGVAGLIKTVLVLEHRQIPPNLHFETPNPQIDFSDGPFYVNTRLRNWPTQSQPRRAGVSSFGLGGTNAHAVLEEPPAATAAGPSRKHQLLVLSGHTPAALECVTDRLAEYLRVQPSAALSDVAHTLRRGRRTLRHRRVLIVGPGDDAAALLESSAETRLREVVEEERNRPVAFLLTGVGEQYVGMARRTYDEEPEFRYALDRCCEVLEPRLGLDLRHLLFPAEELGGANVSERVTVGRETAEVGVDLRRWLGRSTAAAPPVAPSEETDRLERTLYAQPAVFAVGYALAHTWISWGVRPCALIGYSLGEYLAACLSGALSLEDALTLVAERARLIDELPAGVMLAVALPEKEVVHRLKDDVGLAAVNAPHLSVVAGPEAAVSELQEQLLAEGVAARRLRTTHAFHSPMMQPIAERFAAVAARVRPVPLRVPYLSNVTGTWATVEELAAPDYWVRHLLGTVRFSEGVQRLLSSSGAALLEVGPGRTLGTFVRQHAGGERPLATSLPSWDEAAATDDSAHLLDALGRLWLAGVPIDWRGFVGHEERRVLAVPDYPFERQRFWIDHEETSRAGDGITTPAAAEAPDVEPSEPLAARGPAFSRPHLPTPYAEPEDREERVVAEIWRGLLGLDRVGRHDSFFELGGHSLLATQVAVRLRDELGVELPLRSLADAPTPARLAEVVRERRAAGFDVAGGLPQVTPDRAARHEPFPLTDVQEAYWIGRGSSLVLGNVATHFYLEKDVPGFDLERYQEAWRRLIDRHDMLRAVFPGDGRQRIRKRVPPYEIQILDLRRESPEHRAALLEQVRREMSHQVLPAETWPLFEVRATLLEEGQVRLHLSYDFLIFDAWSFEILAHELDALYHDPKTPLPALDLSFRDYVMAERSLRKTDLFQRSRDYWLERLDELPPAPELPLAVGPEAVEKPHFVSRAEQLDRARWSRLKTAAQRRGLTPTALLLACFGEVLAAWSRRPRFTLNLTLFNRLPIHPQIEQLVGDFSSLTLLAVDARAHASFAERARQLQRRLWDDLDHRYFSGVQVMRELARRRGSLTAAMMPVVVTSTINLAPASNERVAPKADQGDHVYSISQTPQVWLDHQVTESDGRLFFNWDAVEELFPVGLLDDLFGSYRRLLHYLANDPDAWEEARFDLLPDTQATVREQVNRTAGPCPTTLLHQGFEEQARRRPEHPALVDSGIFLDYGDLDRASARLARQLHSAGAAAGELVAVSAAKGWAQAVGVLAVLRAGAVYLPLDPSLPAERRAGLLHQATVRYAVCDSDSAVIFASHHADVQVLEVEESLLAPGLVTPPEVATRPEDVAYVIYTSGSTGQPKGVTIEHRAAVNTLIDVVERFSVGPEDRVLALSSLSFDLSVFDLFGLWAAGGTVVLPHTTSDRDPAAWAETIARERVTVWNSVPALLQLLVDYAEGRPGVDLSSLRLVLLSGDWIPVELPRRLHQSVETAQGASRPQVVSLGGATEAAVWSISHPTEGPEEGWVSIPYGRPLRNQRFYVLDDCLEPRPDWVPGQLYIAGDGVARCYWRDPRRTAERFVPHPVTGERLYRTGDLGRWRPEGVLEFLGREDSQVKVQGHRIELGEVEAALATHPAVSAAVAAAVGPQQGSKRLVAYVVPDDASSSTRTDLEEPLRAWLFSKLPSYMIPSAFVVLDRLPLTANGKVDRRHLPEPGAPGRSAAARGSADGLARRIEALVADALGVESVSPHNNLLELGATSIEIIKLATRLHQEMGAHPELEDLFTLQDVAALTAWFEERRLEPAARESPPPEAARGPDDPFAQWYEVIFDPDERDRFKARRPGLRRFSKTTAAVVLAGIGDGDGVSQVLRRISVRRFATIPLPAERLGRLLAHLADLSAAAGGEPEHRYASAGGLYPLQTYVEVKPGRVDGLEAGLWYHDPSHHQLVAVAPGAVTHPRQHAWVNRTIYDGAAFCLYLVADIAAIGPMYGAIGKDYCWLEAGLISQLLENAAPVLGIGLCQIGIGGVEVASLRELLGLGDQHLVVHCLYGGLLATTFGDPQSRQAPPHRAEESGEVWEEGEF